MSVNNTQFLCFPAAGRREYWFIFSLFMRLRHDLDQCLLPVFIGIFRPEVETQLYFWSQIRG